MFNDQSSFMFLSGHRDRARRSRPIVKPPWFPLKVVGIYVQDISKLKQMSLMRVVSTVGRVPYVCITISM